jgi:hypothetical protein
MAERREYRLKIDGFTRETLPMKRLVEYLSDVSVLFGEESAVHLIAVESSSACPVILVDWEAEPKIADRISRARHKDGPEEAVRAIQSINARLQRDNSSAQLLSPAKTKILEFPGAKQPKPIEWPSINQGGTLFGIPIAVGGKNDPVPIHLQDGPAEYNLLADRARAKEIAQFLFTTVLKITGRGRWRKTSGGAWDLERFLVDDFEPVKIANLEDTLAQLRGVDAAWKHADDPLGALEEIRTGEPSKPNGGIR